MTLISELTAKGLAHPPDFVITNTVYETVMGSQAYGCSQDSSDKDVYGFCIPPLDMIFPHLRGEIDGFGTQQQRFEQYQEHHLVDNTAEYDISIYSIVKYFQLMMGNNPNMLDSIFTCDVDVITQTKISKMVRDNRKIFIHRGAYYKYTGFAHSQFHKIKNKNGHLNQSRAASIATFGYDTKYAGHMLRLMLEAEQILNTGDFNIKRDGDYLLEVRQGKYSLSELEIEFNRLDKVMLTAYENSTLQDRPDEKAIKELLLNCIEEFHGKLEFFKL